MRIHQNDSVAGCEISIELELLAQGFSWDFDQSIPKGLFKVGLDKFINTAYPYSHRLTCAWLACTGYEIDGSSRHDFVAAPNET